MRNLLIIILLAIGITAKAQNSILSFTNEKQSTIEQPKRQVEDKGLDGIEVNYEILNANLKIQNINFLHNNISFQQISIPGFSYLQKPGQAALPIHLEIIAVPKGSDYRIEVKSAASKQQNGFKIYPAREPARDTEGAPEPEFVYDNDYYNSNQFYPNQPIEIIEELEIRGMKYLVVQISPIQYNPSKSEIITHSQLNFQIKFNPAESFFDYKNHTQTFINTMLASVLNHKGFLNDYKEYLSIQNTAGNSPLHTDYLIITQNSFLAAADSLAQWKRQMGHEVEIITALNWTTSTVKSAIANFYQNATIKPDYFVILGDVQQVPAELFTAPDASGTYGTDLYYACMGPNNDYIPEMAHGRISVSSATQAIQVVQKIINYERNPIIDSAFYQNGLNCAQFQDDDLDGFADRRFTHTSEDVRNYTMLQGYDIQRIYYTDNNVFPTNYNAGFYSNSEPIPAILSKTNGFNWNGGATEIKNAINAGKFYVLHRDHGFAGGSGWAHPYFVSSSISTLSNGNKLPVVFSINCHTGEFTLPTCFAETFLRHANGGAVGVFGASYYSYSGYNDGLTGGLFDAIWSNPGLIPIFGSGGFGSPTVNSHGDILNMGFVLNHGLLRMRQTWAGNTNSNIYSYRLFHYFGDPAMRMWTKQPTVLTANHSTSINCSDTLFQITNCNDTLAIATLTSNGQLLGVGQIVNGTGNINIQYVVGQTIKLTITARDRKPYITTINVNPSNGLSLQSVVTNNICYGDSLGTIRIQPSCGTPPYQIIWNDNSTSDIRQNLPGGTYIVTVSDSANNSITDTLKVWAPSQPLTINSLSTDAKCYFESSGKIELNTTGGAPPYSYQWNIGSTSEYAYNLAAGNYAVVITDSAGCQKSENFSINQPSAMNLIATATDDTTNNCTGTGTALINGGTPPYSFSWNDAQNQTTAHATGLCKGLYKVTVMDSNQCIQFRTIIISNTAGYNDASLVDKFSIFPNPANDKITITIDSENEQIVTIQIIDALGKIVKQIDNGQINNNKIIIDISQLSHGIYTVNTQLSNNQIVTKKLIINQK